MSQGNRLSSRQVYEGRVVRLAVDEVRLPNGKVTELEVVRHPGAAAVVPMTEKGEVLLLRQYRWAAGGWLWEVPAGTLRSGESPETCAYRELTEETGCEAGELTPLGWILSSPGFCDERIWLFLATDLAPSSPSLDEDELLSVTPLPFVRAVEMVVGGEISDGKSVAALMRADRHLTESAS